MGGSGYNTIHIEMKLSKELTVAVGMVGEGVTQSMGTFGHSADFLMHTMTCPANASLRTVEGNKGRPDLRQGWACA